MENHDNIYDNDIFIRNGIKNLEDLESFLKRNIPSHMDLKTIKEIPKDALTLLLWTTISITMNDDQKKGLAAGFTILASILPGQKLKSNINILEYIVAILEPEEILEIIVGIKEVFYDG
jgi:hypothetical protein